MSHPSTCHDPWHEIQTEVRYAESDQMGYAHHSCAVIWFELGRVGWLRDQGTPYRKLEAQGTLLPVVSLSIRYQVPARFEDQVVIQTRLAEVTRARVVLDNRVLRVNRPEAGLTTERTLLAEGRVELACVDRQGRVQRLPEELRARWAGECPPPAPPAG